MVESRSLRRMLAAVLLLVSLSGCGGSGDGIVAASAAKTASWTDLTVLAQDGKANISWEKAAGTSFGSTAPVYNVYCSTSPENLVAQSNRIATNYIGRSFDHSDVANGTRYYYAVTTVTEGVEGPASRTVSATPQAALPAAPYGLKVAALDSSVRLDFRGATPAGAVALTYNLYRATTRGGFTATNRIESNLAAASLSPYVDSTVINGTTYYYAVTAVSTAGKESNFSPAVSATPQQTTVGGNSTPTQLASFAAPSQTSAVPGNGFCEIAWSNVAPITISAPDPAASPTQVSPYYILHWSDLPDVLNNPSGSVANVTKDAATGTYRLPGLSTGTRYYVQVVAAIRDAAGNPIPGRFTAGPAVSVVPSGKIPAAPSGISATQGTQQVSLSWNRDASDVSGSTVTYNVYVSTTAPASAAELVTTGTRKNNIDSTKTYFTHTGLQPGTTYYYTVTAVREGESAPGPVVSVTL